jgi:peptidoglycan L-alanyl-D-glutamate endopeptidase CwlK
MTLNATSMKRLNGVHPDLVKVVVRAAGISETPFIVTEGRRTLERQKQLVAAGASRTMKSRHLTGHAVDFAPVVDGQVTWKWPAFYPVAAAFKKASKSLGVPILWGGDFKTFKDGPHIELDRKYYP